MQFRSTLVISAKARRGRQQMEKKFHREIRPGRGLTLINWILLYARRCMYKYLICAHFIWRAVDVFDGICTNGVRINANVEKGGIFEYV